MPVFDDQSLEMALWHCETEPVHRPGLIQPNGALIAVEPADGTIVFASENTHRILRVEHGALLSKPVDRMFGQKLASVPDETACSEHDASMQYLGVMQFASAKVAVSVAEERAHRIYEFEQVAGNGATDTPTAREKNEALARIAAARSQEELCDMTVRLLQKYSGYTCVMVYRFGQDGHGEVIAEAVASGMGRFLGLRFPSWEIPVQARALMQKVPFRYIADVNATAVAVRAAHMLLPPLDMTYAHLRASSPLHHEYLRNMGAAASFTLNLTAGRQLWGMIAMHHGTPRKPSPALRRFGMDLAREFVKTIDRVSSADRVLQETRAGALRTELQLFCARNHPDPQSLLDTLCAVFEADGAVLAGPDKKVSVGMVPASSAVAALLNSMSFINGLCVTTKRRPTIPGFYGACVLALKPSASDTLVLFRCAATKTVKWAGAPTKTLRRDDGQVQLAPRPSFSAHHEVLTDHIIPWTDNQLHLARSLLVPTVGRTPD